MICELDTEIGRFEVEMEQKSSVASQLVSICPVSGEAKNIGGEIFFIVDVDVPFDGSEREVFEVGDLVYWRSKKEDKFAVAVFYGNTKFGDGTRPRAAGPCVRIGRVIGDVSGLKDVQSGSPIALISSVDKN